MQKQMSAMGDKRTSRFNTGCDRLNAIGQGALLNEIRLLSARSGHRITYSITSSALASSVGGTVMPSALAVLRLITS